MLSRTLRPGAFRRFAPPNNAREPWSGLVHSRIGVLHADAICTVHYFRMNFMPLGLMLFAAASLVEPAQTPSIDPSTPWHEEYRGDRRVPVAGSEWVGFTVADREKNVDATRAFVRLPAGATGYLCLEISSRDGVFYGAGEYRLPRGGSTSIRLNIPTKHRRELSIYSSDELVARALLAASCPSSTGAYLPVSWTSAGAYDHVVISVNSSNTPTSVLWRSNGRDHRVSCTPLRAPQRPTRSFDQSCDVPRASLGDSAQVVVRRCPLGKCNDVWKTVKLP